MTTTVGKAALGTVNLMISIGADNSYSFRYCTKDEQGVITPVDLTGYTAKAMVRRDYGTVPILDLTPHIVLNDEPGRIDIVLPASATVDVKATNGVWDLVLTDPFGGITRFVQGHATASLGVTL